MIRYLTALAICMAMMGCMETGLGDPATSRIDPKIEGVWQSPTSDLLLVKSWDAHTYVISTLTQTTGEGDRKYAASAPWRAWLTPVAGRTFITLDRSPSDVVEVKKRYAVAQIELKGDQITVLGVSPEFVEAAKTPADLERLIVNNLNDPKLWVGEPSVYTRQTARIAKEIGG